MSGTGSGPSALMRECQVKSRNVSLLPSCLQRICSVVLLCAALLARVLKCADSITVVLVGVVCTAATYRVDRMPLITCSSSHFCYDAFIDSFDRYRGVFADNEIAGEHLLDLDKNDMKELVSVCCFCVSAVHSKEHENNHTQVHSRMHALTHTHTHTHTRTRTLQSHAHLLTSFSSLSHSCTTTRQGVTVLGHRMTIDKGLATLRAAVAHSQSQSHDDDDGSDSDTSYHC